MGGEIIIRVFFTILDNLKLYHWDTKKYSRHVSTDNLHNKLSELIDKFVEVYIGKYGRPVFTESFSVKIKQYNDQNITVALKSYINFLTNDLVTHLDPKIDYDLFNIRDEILSELNKTMYLYTLN